jgi:transporter family-2 protein
LPKLPYILAAVVIGGLLTLQAGFNADVARRVGNPFGAAVISVSVSFTLAVSYYLATRQHLAWGAVAGVPKYLFLAGFVGFIFVIGTIWLAPILGATLLFAAIVAGQMIVATIADYTGIAAYQSQTFDPWRIVGIGLVLAGVWIFQRAA